MGNAKFYFYPEPNGSHLIELDIGEALGEMYSDVTVEAQDGVTLTGRITRSVGRMQEIVTIQRDRMLLGEDLAYQFIALQNHLDRGYSCAFSADDDKSYCFPLRGVQAAGTFNLSAYGNPFLNFVGQNCAMAINDYVVIETSSPALIQEQVKIKANGNIGNAGGSFEIYKRLNFQYDQPAFARYYRFFPVLKRPQSDIGQSIITQENGRLFSLNLRLVVDYSTLYAFHPQFQAESGVEIGSGLIGRSPDSGEIPSNPQGGLDGVPRRVGNTFISPIEQQEIVPPEIQGSIG
jgi:hypothetical protein